MARDLLDRGPLVSFTQGYATFALLQLLRPNIGSPLWGFFSSENGVHYKAEPFDRMPRDCRLAPHHTYNRPELDAHGVERSEPPGKH